MAEEKVEKAEEKPQESAEEDSAEVKIENKDKERKTTNLEKNVLIKTDNDALINYYEKKAEEANLTENRSELKKRYEKMKYESGEAIGVIAAQSIAEPATQTTLQSYHRVSGGKLLTTKGLPRIIEIFDARAEPKTPMMKIYLEDDHNTKEKALEIASIVKESKLKQIISEDSLDMVNLKVEIKLDENQIKNLQINIDDAVKTMKKNVKNVNITAEDNVIIIESKKTNISINELQMLRIKVREMPIKGTKGVEQCIIEKEGELWVIYTLGSNLKKVLKIEGVDSKKTTTNNIKEIASVLGIEAGRSAIINEVTDTLREQGVDTDTRHLLLVADVMAWHGVIDSIGRYGVSGKKKSILARANFEETIKHLTNAAIGGETEEFKGIIENVMVGNLAPVGTGLVKLKLKG